MAEFKRIADDVWMWADDACNAYVIRDGDAAILIDLGDGALLDRLGDIGVRSVEWVLFTHHHREQCQGSEKLKSWNAKVATPELERQFFERPASFRRMKPTLNDPFSVYGESFVRPPIDAMKVDRGFAKMDDFTWRGREIWCLDTSGNSPGHMSYLLKRADGRWIAFSGDVMLDGATMHTWFDTEWDYGFAKGIYALHNAAALLDNFDPAMLLPSHGPVVAEPRKQLRAYQAKLRELAKHYVRGYEIFTFAAADQDTVSKPTSVPHVWQITPHLYKFKGPDYWPNFTMLLADSGRALVIDCGLFDKAFLDKSLTLMKERLGLKQIDAVVVTHFHGDHCQEAPHLREKWGAQIWFFDRAAAKIKSPLRFDLAAPINAYGKNIDSIAPDRVLRDGETFQWEGYALTCDWMPGQTEFAMCVHGEIDGRSVAFTGDNLFASTTDPNQTGHEAVVARNSCIPEESYIHAALYLHGLAPDLIIGGHSWVMDRPLRLIERYHQGAIALRDALRTLSPIDDYRYWFDPFWVRPDPYRTTLKPGGSGEVVVHIRNFRDRAEEHRITIQTAAGITAEPASLQGKLPPESRASFTVKLSASPTAQRGVTTIVFDATLDGRRHGPLFDAIVEVA